MSTTLPRRSHKQRVLELLADGRPHPHTEGYRLGVMLHSRVSDLRKDGHNIRSWREGDTYLYQLVGLLDATEASPSTGLPSPVQPSPVSVASSRATTKADGVTPRVALLEQLNLLGAA